MSQSGLVRLVVQRVSSASVTVEDEVVGAIGSGLLILVGLEASDEERDLAAAVEKLIGLRVFADRAGAMNRSVIEIGGSVLLVSQFTLLADVRRGRRPSLAGAAPPETAAVMFEQLVTAFAASGVPTESGRFGARMEVSLVNDGPVTLVLDVKEGRVS
jgi:D-tyrosyl-tRNA(Tyr) deacylase